MSLRSITNMLTNNFGLLYGDIFDIKTTYVIIIAFEVLRYFSTFRLKGRKTRQSLAMATVYDIGIVGTSGCRVTNDYTTFYKWVWQPELK